MSGEISRGQVAHLAHLARLELSEEEVARYAEQLSAILEHVDAVRRLDTASVPPMAHALARTNVLRPDEVRPGLERDDVLTEAPSSEEGRFKVTRIIGEAP